MKLFGTRLADAITAKKSVAVIGIDPRPDQLPPSLQAEAKTSVGVTSSFEAFGLGILDAVSDLVPAVKPNIAFFEAFGVPGLIAYNRICQAAQDRGLLVIGDIKRGDIGSTAAAYAAGHLHYDGDPSPDLYRCHLGVHDAVTLNPYLGRDSLTPFLQSARPNGHGLFILVKTSNPSSADLQDLILQDGSTVAEASAKLVNEIGEIGLREGWSDVGAVVGATHPTELAKYRQLMPRTPFLIPGYGAQGGTAADIVDAFDEEGQGGLVNASRSVIFAWKNEDNPTDWIGAARRATQAMNHDLATALRQAGKWPF